MYQELSNEEACKCFIAEEEKHSQHFLELGRKLIIYQNEKWYEPMYKSFAEFCKQMPYSQAYISRVMNIYQKFACEYKYDIEFLADIGMGTLSDILPFCTNKTSADFWVAKAKLPRATLRKEILAFKELANIVNDATLIHRE